MKDNGNEMDFEVEEQQNYDQIMTGWDPIRPIAGQKRAHSPEFQTMQTKRGREVRKFDYHRLHHGMAVQAYSNPQTWEEAMTCIEAPQ